MGGEVQWTCRVAGVGVGAGVEPVVELGVEQAGSTTKLALTPTQLHALVHGKLGVRVLRDIIVIAHYYHYHYYVTNTFCLGAQYVSVF